MLAVLGAWFLLADFAQRTPPLYCVPGQARQKSSGNWLQVSAMITGRLLSTRLLLWYQTLFVGRIGDNLDRGAVAPSLFRNKVCFNAYRLNFSETVLRLIFARVAELRLFTIHDA